MQPPEIDEAAALVWRGAVDVLPADEMRAKLARGRPLRVKAGFDPTAPDLHLGHFVLLNKMRHFQSLGHTAIFLIGDFTAMIGDPSGKNAARPPLSPAVIEQNARTYAEQALKILDRDKTEIRRNSEWFGKMSAADMIRLAARGTVARMLERDDFSARAKAQKPIAIHEFLYPLAQGHDSVALRADVELGGTDQKFNLLVGRELQRQAGFEGQCILTTPILEGLDGAQKMSKSLGNHIGVCEPPEQIFGKIMSVGDDLMWRYYELLSFVDARKIAARKKAVAAGVNPSAPKRELAREIVARFYSPSAARAAEADFNARFVRREPPAQMPEVVVDCAGKPSLPLFYLLKAAGLCASSSAGKRETLAGGVRIDGQKAASPETAVAAGSKIVLQVGRRRFARVFVKP